MRRMVRVKKIATEMIVPTVNMNPRMSSRLASITKYSPEE